MNSNNQKISPEYNLKTIYPKLSKLWDYEKNYPLKPEEVYPNSGKEYWWKCEKNHTWKMKPNNFHKQECPYCNHERVSKEYNLAVLYPKVAKQWDYERNYPLKPEEFFPRSQKKVWWICSYNNEHRWKSSITNRVRNEFGCPICRNQSKTSFPEQAIYFYIKKIFSEAKNRYLFNKKEIDIYIPSLKLGIEYDGIYHHRGEKIKKDLEKDKFLKKYNINLLRIKESLDAKETIIKGNTIICNFDYKYRFINNVIEKIIEYIRKNYNINVCSVKADVEKDFIRILEQYLVLRKENSIANKFPALIQEWDNEKNGNITPYMIDYGSGRKFWWKCKKGHSWLDSALHRTSKNRKCPYCSNHRIIYENTLFIKNPELSKLWNYEKNDGLTPMDVSPKSNRKIWWKCENNHEWVSRVRDATTFSNCPYCNNRRLTNTNNLGVLFPNLEKEWDYDKNEKTPFEYLRTSKEEVYWKCEKGHSWKARISNRTFLNRGCPYCHNHIVNEGQALSDKFPDLMKEWNYEKNKNVNPSKLFPYSCKKVWWKCSNCGHEWQMKAIDRTKHGCSCHRCVYIKRSGSILDLYPDLMREWNYEKNININPAFISPGSGKKVYWKCSKCNYEWITRVSHRVSDGTGCPKCHHFSFNLKKA